MIPTRMKPGIFVLQVEDAILVDIANCYLYTYAYTTIQKRHLYCCQNRITHSYSRIRFLVPTVYGTGLHSKQRGLLPTGNEQQETAIETKHDYNSLIHQRSYSDATSNFLSEMKGGFLIIYIRCSVAFCEQRALVSIINSKTQWIRHILVFPYLKC